MTNSTRDSLIKRPFMDKKHYPYGFARSGDFSIKEAKILAENGSVIAALVDGKLTPETDQDMRFIAVAHGETEPASPEEKVWLKYQKRINRPKAASIYGSKKVALTESDDDGGTADDTDIVLDDD
ncbi:DUF413 domain-containing protein [Alteromonas sp. 1_MG-2023]|uniref:DUF413 domain-containing protein n=1 Tax=Alteromonas sp. 1_MG-2023 TaxID=3062669 RepID=UPI0026E1E1FC|nr:DUF413 domain-containing protein [Alteromonas sp. 1_MG-2023]MDO6477867.1 DUF413 domain-containing protein [Alteromonas sp. 1_MG-2023]